MTKPAAADDRDMQALSHADLCAIAVRWLKKPFSAGGHACQVAFPEVRTSYLSGEIPDALGFRVSSCEYGGGSVLVECKRSRADFLKDALKPWRAPGQGIGRFRYFLCPAGLVQPDELPPGWGLVWVDRRGRVSPRVGAFQSIRTPGAFDNEHATFDETLLLANLLHRVGDPEKANARLRDADRLNTTLMRRIRSLEASVERLSYQSWADQGRSLVEQIHGKAEIAEGVSSGEEPPGN